MKDELQINNSILRLFKGDITDIEVEAFVYYARNDLKLGSGFGTAIAMRGGLAVQEELDKIGEQDTTAAVISNAGEMKAKHIIHAVGPKFQEENTESKLKKTITNSLNIAEENSIKQIAFPPMGAGFYGVPLDDSARITIDTIAEYLSGKTNIKEIIVCPLDNHEFKPFQKKLSERS